MKTIEEGEFFEINTSNKMEAVKIVLDNLKDRRSWDKGQAVRKLYEEEVYTQKQDCKDFIKNVVRSENIEVVSAGRREICLTGRKVVNPQ